MYVHSFLINFHGNYFRNSFQTIRFRYSNCSANECRIFDHCASNTMTSRDLTTTFVQHSIRVSINYWMFFFQDDIIKLIANRSIWPHLQHFSIRSDNIVDESLDCLFSCGKQLVSFGIDQLTDEYVVFIINIRCFVVRCVHSSSISIDRLLRSRSASTV